jgi:hypothetical protein
MSPKKGWEKNGIFRMAHEKVIEMIFDKCKTMDEENKLYEFLFNRQVNSMKKKTDKQRIAYEERKLKAKADRQALKAAGKSEAA